MEKGGNKKSLPVGEHSGSDIADDHSDEEQDQDIRAQPAMSEEDISEKLSVHEGEAKEKPGRKKKKTDKVKVETDPLLMTLPELTKFLQAKAVKRKTRVAQRQRAALLGFLPPGMLPPTKVFGKQIPVPESLAELKDTTTEPKLPAGSKAVVQKIPKIRRKSLLEHMESRMEQRGHKTVLFRLVLIGSHEENPNDLLTHQEKKVKEFNVAPEVELLSGLLLIYPNYFVHVLEGSEMVLANYIADAAYEFEKKPTLPNLEDDDQVLHVHMIILCMIQVDQRHSRYWHGAVTSDPPHQNLMEINGYQKRLFEFLKQLWILIMVAKNFVTLLPPIKGLQEETPAGSDGGTRGSEQGTTPTPISEEVAAPPISPPDSPEDNNNIESEQQDQVGSAESPIEEVENNELVDELMEEMLKLLPSVGILQYFLKDKERCPKLLTPQQHINTYWSLSNDPSWRDVAWPIPSRLHPYD